MSEARLIRVVGKVNWKELIAEAKCDFRCPVCDEMKGWRQAVEGQVSHGPGRPTTFHVCKKCVKENGK